MRGGTPLFGRSLGAELRGESGDMSKESPARTHIEINGKVYVLQYFMVGHVRIGSTVPITSPTVGSE